MAVVYNLLGGWLKVISDKMHVKESTIEGAGRGVFARCQIPKGATVSECYLLEIATPEHCIQTLKDTGVYWWAFRCREGRKDRMTLALGDLTLMNHSDEPNVRIVEDKHGQSLSAIAICDIYRDDEIVHKYMNSGEYDFGSHSKPTNHQAESAGRDPASGPQTRN